MFGTPKWTRLRLDALPYKGLHRSILERNGWDYQYRGAQKDLQVHQVQSRRLLGDDVEENLITIYAHDHSQYPTSGSFRCRGSGSAWCRMSLFEYWQRGISRTSGSTNVKAVSSISPLGDS